MPAVSLSPVRDRLRDAVEDAIALNARLEEIIAEKSRLPAEGKHGKTSHSPAPWNSAVAGAVMDLHSFARFAERQARHALGLPYRARGGSSANTEKALRLLLRLEEAADDWLPSEHARELGRWARKAQVILGDEQAVQRQVSRLPKIYGQAAARCPWCKRDTLRQKAVEGVIFCITPDCRDDRGRRPRAELEPFRGEFVLRWQDGVIGVPA